MMPTPTPRAAALLPARALAASGVALLMLAMIAPSASCKRAEATCGDGVCEGLETPGNCRDCGGPECGDGVCAAVEILSGSCEEDCVAVCGDGACNTSVGESCGTCADDCGACILSCGDGTCDPAAAEACNTCPADCGACEPENTAATCADGIDNDADSLVDCADDDCALECLPPCGDTLCESDEGENCQLCAADCGACLPACDPAACNPFSGETCINCPDACSCGTGSCATGWACLDLCIPSDSDCILGCYEQTCGDSQAPLVNVINCADTTCASFCIGGYGTFACNECMQNLCDTQLGNCPFTC